MTINNAELYMAGVWDWGLLDGCFGMTRIKPTDIDGLIERNGKCLFLETKRPGVCVPMGQAITHKALVSSGHSVLIIWGHTNAPSKLKLLTPSVTRTYESADLQTLRGIVQKWFTWANKQTHPGVSRCQSAYCNQQRVALQVGEQ